MLSLSEQQCTYRDVTQVQYTPYTLVVIDNRKFVCILLVDARKLNGSCAFCRSSPLETDACLVISIGMSDTTSEWELCIRIT